MTAGRLEDSGLQAERTQLSWERSALGLLGNGALVLLREAGTQAVAYLCLAIAAVVLAIAVVGLGAVRRRSLETSRIISGRTTVGSPRLAVVVIGYGTAAFAAAILILSNF